jgi:hypothetical protein
MKNKKLNLQTKKVGIGLLAGVLVPGAAWACACGCGVFDVGGSSMLPAGEGGMAYLNYDYQDQNQNWSDSSRAPAENNNDKEIRTHFVTLGLQYMFNRRWGVQAELPFANRYFKTLDDAGDLVSRHWNALGDLRIEGIYTGFAADLSSGLTFGLKLPTGSYDRDADVVDRDTEIGSGSTDILLGGFHRGNLTADEKWDWFAQAKLDLPVLTKGDYRPGFEADAAAGIDYKGISFGRLRISPLAQVIISERTSDYGAAADSANSGYTRILLSPGIEFHFHPVKVYADVELPVFQHVTGNQIVAPALFKLNVSYMF